MQNGLAMITADKTTIPRIHAFQAKRLPKSLKSPVFPSESSIPDKVPEGQRYLQKNGVSLTQIGSIITNTIRITYLSLLKYLSALNFFNLKGNGIL